MKKIISILIPILAFIFLVGGTYYYFTSGNKNFKEEYSKYIEKLDNFEDLEKYLDRIVDEDGYIRPDASLEMIHMISIQV